MEQVVPLKGGEGGGGVPAISRPLASPASPCRWRARAGLLSLLRRSVGHHYIGRHPSALKSSRLVGGPPLVRHEGLGLGEVVVRAADGLRVGDGEALQVGGELGREGLLGEGGKKAW